MVSRRASCSSGTIKFCFRSRSNCCQGKTSLLGSVPELQEARRDTIEDFYREIGVRIPDDKRERMITDEVNAGEAQTFIRRDVWYKSLTESLKRFNAFMDTDIAVKANEPIREGVDYYAL